MSIAIMLLIVVNVAQAYRSYKYESRLYKIREAVNKACENADPDLNHDTLDELIMDIWYAMYK
jgi:hypothetical protein|nr:MAG TPA: hypothetical protein [Caudoviricetes sp.]